MASVVLELPKRDELEDLGGQERLDLAVELQQARSRIDALLAADLVVIERHGDAETLTGLKTPQAIARAATCSPGTIKRLKNVGEKLDVWLPDTHRMFSEGEVSLEHAAVMADCCNPRNDTEFAALEADLIAEAPGMTFTRWKDYVRDIARTLDQDGAYDPDDDLARNELVLHFGLDDLDALGIAGQFVGEQRIIVDHVLNTEADRLYRQYAEDAKVDPSIQVPSRRTLLALAFAEICRKSQCVDLTKPGVMAKTDATPVIAAEDLTDIRDERGIRLQHGRVGCLLCDSRLHPIVVDSLGVPLGMGRTIRLANAAQRRALRVLDGGCTFPGCTAHVTHTEAHHIDEFAADLGSTDVNRMTSPCRHHHGVIHRRGWTVDIDDDGWTTFTTPQGLVIHGQRHGRTRPPDQ